MIEPWAGKWISPAGTWRAPSVSLTKTSDDWSWRGRSVSLNLSIFTIPYISRKNAGTEAFRPKLTFNIFRLRLQEVEGWRLGLALVTDPQYKRTIAVFVVTCPRILQIGPAGATKKQNGDKAPSFLIGQFHSERQESNCQMPHTPCAVISCHLSLQNDGNSRASEATAKWQWRCMKILRNALRPAFYHLHACFKWLTELIVDSFDLQIGPAGDPMITTTTMAQAHMFLLRNRYCNSEALIKIRDLDWSCLATAAPRIPVDMSHRTWHMAPFCRPVVLLHILREPELGEELQAIYRSGNGFEVCRVQGLIGV